MKTRLYMHTWWPKRVGAVSGYPTDPQPFRVVGSCHSAFATSLTEPLPVGTEVALCIRTLVPLGGVDAPAPASQQRFLSLDDVDSEDADHCFAYVRGIVEWHHYDAQNDVLTCMLEPKPGDPCASRLRSFAPVVHNPYTQPAAPAWSAREQQHVPPLAPGEVQPKLVLNPANMPPPGAFLVTEHLNFLGLTDAEFNASGAEIANQFAETLEAVQFEQLASWSRPPDSDADEGTEE